MLMRCPRPRREFWPIGAVVLSALLALAPSASGQVVNSSPATPDTEPPKAEPQVRVPPPGAPPQKPRPSALGRWFDLQAATVGARYRMVETNTAVISANQVQDNAQFKGRFKFDAKATWTLNAVYATGSNFSGGWNNTGLGTGDPFTHLYVKQLFVAWAPVSGVEASYGSTGYFRGESTEITTFDNDGYMSGERISVKRPRQFHLDEFGAARGYVGDVSRPGVFDRWDRFTGGRNYFQIFAAKKFKKFFSVSGDYAHLDGAPMWHGAVTAKIPAARVVDTLRFEGYTRTGTTGGSGYSVYVEKTMRKRAAAGVGYATIDPLAPTLNGDRFLRGQRYFVSGSYKLGFDFTAQAFWGQAFHNAITIANQKRLDAIISYNALAGFQRIGWFR